MCVLLGPAVIINNAFEARKNEQLDYMEMNALKNFCSIVYDKISENNNSQYKYVYLQADEADLEEFCEMDENFIKGINKIYRVNPIQEEALLQVNNIYPKEVRLSLENARKEFACSF